MAAIAFEGWMPPQTDAYDPDFSTNVFERINKRRRARVQAGRHMTRRTTRLEEVSYQAGRIVGKVGSFITRHLAIPPRYEDAPTAPYTDFNYGKSMAADVSRSSEQPTIAAAAEITTEPVAMTAEIPQERAEPRGPAITADSLAYLSRMPSTIGVGHNESTIWSTARQN